MNDFDLTKMSDEELHSLNHQVCELLKLRRERAARSVVNALRIGDKVEYTYKGVEYKGTVHKINRKTVVVDHGPDSNIPLCKCSASMLRKVA